MFINHCNWVGKVTKKSTEDPLYAMAGIRWLLVYFVSVRTPIRGSDQHYETFGLRIGTSQVAYMRSARITSHILSSSSSQLISALPVACDSNIS